MPSPSNAAAGVLVVTFGPARLVHVAPAKVGSTSIMQAYAQMAGLEVAQGAVRSDLRRDGRKDRLAAAGVVMRYVPMTALAELVAELVAARPGWQVLANVRSPYERAVSNWHSKLNRYAKAFHPLVYCRGKLGQLVEGPKAWPHTERANVHMQRHIPFRAMLEGLARRGVGFDLHFEEQALLLALAQVRYDRIIRLEAFATAFPAALAELGVAPVFTDRLALVPHSNRTVEGAGRAGLLDAATVALIDRAYPQDTARLGYDAPVLAQVA